MNLTPARLFHRQAFSAQGMVRFCLSTAFSLTLGLLIYSLLDVSLGSIFAMVFLSGLLGMGFSQESIHPGQWIGVSFGISLGCCSPMILGLISIGYAFPEILGLVLMIWAVCAWMMSMTLGLSRLIGRGPGGGLSILVFLGWLTWPVWMSPYFHTPWGQWCVDHLLSYQPFFALSSLFPAMGDWSHAPIAYAYLTNLGQDVLYALPEGVGKALAWHGLLAGIWGWVALWPRPTVVCRR